MASRLLARRDAPLRRAARLTPYRARPTLARDMSTNSPLPAPFRTLRRAAYALGQSARVGLYFGQYRLSQRLTTPLAATRGAPGPFPDSRAILEDLRRLFARDLAAVEAGLYRRPHDLFGGLAQAVGRAGAYFRDLPAVERRRHAGEGQEVWQGGPRRGYPRYYQQNFHFQSDGWFSRRSAQLYDHQVEVLFAGGADAMRRLALPPLRQALAGRRQQDCRLLDLGCGTGRLLSFVKDNWPRLPALGLDLSPAYLAEAAATLAPWRSWQLLQAPAESVPLADGSLDAVTAVFLFHELPRKVRAAVLAEAARLLRPGGRMILVDSLQHGDRPAYDRLLDLFPVAFHEPYYADYLGHDLVAEAERAGLSAVEADCAYFAKLLVFEKAAP